jgi:ABC-type nickel/cobalt efflux system permease component RcnA
MVMYTKVVAQRGMKPLRPRSVGAIVVAAAMAVGTVVTLAGGAAAANQHSKAVKHQSRTTAHAPKPGTRDVGLTG